MSDTQIVETPEVVTTEQPDAAPVTETKETFDQTLERVAREVTTGGTRAPDGRFQAKVVAQGAPEVAEVPGRPEAAAPELAQPAIAAPQSLPDDVKKVWDTLPRAIQEAWSKREGEAHEKITADGQRLKSLSAFEEVLKPFEQRLKQVNAPPQEYIRRLATADHMLSTNFDEAIGDLYRMYGRTPPQSNGNQPGPQAHPQLQNVEALVDQRVQKVLLDQRVEAKSEEIDKFKAALPAEDQPDFDKLEPLMAGLYQANPKWTLGDLYKAARRADPDTLAKDTAKATAEAQKTAEEEAKKKQAQDKRLAPLGRKPGSAPTGPIKGKTWQETMDTVAKEVLARN